MPRYYCDYCDTYLTHDSPSVRKQHNAGYKHKANVRIYYQQFEEQQTQSMIDQRVKEHLGLAGAFPNVGAAFNQHLAQRPGFPIMRPPVLPIPGSVPPPLMGGIRHPVLPRPLPVPPPGYMQGMPNMGQPGAPMHMNVLPGPPPMNPSLSAPGGMMGPSSITGSSTATHPMYLSNPNGGFDLNADPSH